MARRQVFVRRTTTDAILSCVWLLAACSTPRAYPLNQSNGGYGEILAARAECQSAGGEVVAPAGEAADLRGYRCVFPEEPKVRACRQWRMTESDINGIHELGLTCMDEP